MKEDEKNPIFSAFAAKDIKFHVTKKDRVEDLLNKDFFTFPSKTEKDAYYQKMKKETLTVEAFEEMAISGLGWINVKRGPLRIELSYPENVKIVIRNGIINPKIRRNNEKIKKEND